MKGYCWKGETTHPAGTLTFLFSLLASVSLALLHISTGEPFSQKEILEFSEAAGNLH